MTRFVLLLGIAALVLGGCSGGSVDANQADASYNEQVKKAEALAKQNGEAPPAQGQE